MGSPFPLSVLDLAPVPSGSTESESLRRITDLAQLADRLGYKRLWFAEHHSMPSIASSSPEILIAHVAGKTERIRVGSGGIMLPNHVPLKVAEQFHTLEALFPDRIDFGIGRAPGTDPTTSRALRSFDANQFPEMIAEMQAFSRGGFPANHSLQKVRAVPGDVSLPPIWILGSSGASARYAGKSGFGYGFASHFSPTPAAPAVRAYREAFQPSDRFLEPHVILAVSVVCAETDEEADYLASTMDLVWVRLQRGEFGPLPSPEEARAYDFTPAERAVAERYRALQFVGSPETVRQGIKELVEETQADEVMVTSNIHSHEKRLQSFKLLAEAFDLQPVQSSEQIV